MVNSAQIERPVVIGVTGTHSTGKTTFLSQVKQELKQSGLTVTMMTDLGEQAQRKGLPILFNHTWASTLWFITRGISNELESWPHVDVILVDRPAPDALGYYRAALEHRNEQPDLERMSYLEAIVRNHCQHYDLIFRTTLDPEIPIGTNKIRDPDMDFRTLVDRHIADVLDDLLIQHTLLPADGHAQARARTMDAVTTSMAAFQGDP